MTPGQGRTTKEPRHDPVGPTLRQSHALEYFDTKNGVKTHPEGPDLCKRANQHPASGSEQMDQGGGAEPLRLPVNEQQRPRRSDASAEMVLSSDVQPTNPEAAGTTTESAAGDAEPQRSKSGSDVTEPVKSSLISDSGLAGWNRSDAAAAVEERQDGSPLLITAPIATETEDSSITEATKGFKPHKDPAQNTPTLVLESETTAGGLIVASASEMKEKQTFDRPKPQTSSQRPDAETVAGRVEVEMEVKEVHTHTVTEDQRYKNITLDFNNSALSPDLMTGDSSYLSKSKSTLQTVVSADQPPKDTNTRKGAKLTSGVRGETVRL